MHRRFQSIQTQPLLGPCAGDANWGPFYLGVVVRFIFLVLFLFSSFASAASTTPSVWVTHNDTRSSESTPFASCALEAATDIHKPSVASVTESTPTSYRCKLDYTQPSYDMGYYTVSTVLVSGTGVCASGATLDSSGKCAPPPSVACTTGCNGPNKGHPKCPKNPHTHDPVDIATGNNYEPVHLISFGPLSLDVTYNSSDKNWTNTLAWMVQPDASDAGTLWLHEGDGTLVSLTQDSSGNWQPADASFRPVKATTNGGFEYDTASTLYTFTAKGWLSQIHWRNSGWGVTSNYGTYNVDRNGQTLATVTLNASHQLTKISYGSHIISLTYDANNQLASISRDGATTRTFLYGDSSRPYLLTSVEDAQGRQVASWSYDAQGRVVQNQDGGGLGKTQLQFNSDGSVTVTNPLGKQSIYNFTDVAGGRYLTSVDGQPSQNCAAAHKAITYYSNGLVKTETDWKGHVTAYTYNSRGLQTQRIEAQGTPQQRTITTEWDSRFPLPTKITEPSRVITMTYDDKGHLLTRAESAQ